MKGRRHVRCRGDRERIRSVDTDGDARAAVRGRWKRLEAGDDRIDDRESANEVIGERLAAVEGHHDVADDPRN